MLSQGENTTISTTELTMHRTEAYHRCCRYGESGRQEPALSRVWVWAMSTARCRPQRDGKLSGMSRIKTPAEATRRLPEWASHLIVRAQ